MPGWFSIAQLFLIIMNKWIVYIICTKMQPINKIRMSKMRENYIENIIYNCQKNLHFSTNRSKEWILVLSFCFLQLLNSYRPMRKRKHCDISTFVQKMGMMLLPMLVLWSMTMWLTVTDCCCSEQSLLMIIIALVPMVMQNLCQDTLILIISLWISLEKILLSKLNSYWLPAWDNSHHVGFLPFPRSSLHSDPPLPITIVREADLSKKCSFF